MGSTPILGIVFFFNFIKRFPTAKTPPARGNQEVCLSKNLEVKNMSSKRRMRRKQCTYKVRHKNKNGAYSALRRVYKNNINNHRLHVYKCNFCGGYHLGGF